MNLMESYEDPGGQAEEPLGHRESGMPGWLRETPYWAFSAFLHLILFLLLLTMVRREEDSGAEEASINVRPPPAVPAYDPTLRRDVRKTPKLLDLRKVEAPVVRRKVDTVTPDIPRGTSWDNLTNLELHGASIHDAIGVGGGASGAYGERWGKGSLFREGGSEGTEDAVRAALNWLMRHQSPDGSWKANGFSEECSQTCRNDHPGRYGDGRGSADFDVGVTGLALLAFSGSGHTHRSGRFPEFIECVRKAVHFMKSVQVHSSNPDQNGRYGQREHRKWIYDHAIATMAMAELLVMSQDVISLKRSVREATELCFRSQNPGRGWRYGVRPGDDDVSVTGWMVLALKTARNTRLGIPRESFDESFRAALHYLRQATAADGRAGYRKAGDRDNRSRGWEGPYPFSAEYSCMTAVSVLCRIFAGESRSNPSIQKGVDLLLAHVPRWREKKGKALSTINVYYWYYASYALFQFGGEPWAAWNGRMKKSLLESQRMGGCEDGSWDTMGEWSNQAGRVYITALGAMTLEVYYRFRRLQEGISF